MDSTPSHTSSESRRDSKKNKWSGRFKKKLDPRALRFGQSISFDRKLYAYDIQGSIAHAKMLKRIGLVTPAEAKKLVEGLLSILRDLHEGKIQFREELEDIHTNIESLLTARIGPVGGKLHTGRSRNDQVALDIRLYCRDMLEELHEAIVNLESVLLKKAERHIDVIMPGYTHLQRAQPILFSHHLLAYVEMLERDRERLNEIFGRVNRLPLGSGALAGSTFPLDREFVAKELGFDGVSHNSLDAVSDRDFAIEIASAISILMMHLSRFSEELILWTSQEFQFIHLDESFCTGSSMMPQKMNPDIPELIRGKTGRTYGHLIGLLTTMKGLPLAYNKDMQEDKEPLFDLFETAIPSVAILASMMEGSEPHVSAMAEACGDGLLLTTDLADWLVRQGMSFRSSHEIAAQVARYCLEEEKDLTRLSLEELKKFSSLFHEDVFKHLTPRGAIDSRRSTGGTARANVKKEIRRIWKLL